MSQVESSSILTNLSVFLGTNEAALKLLLTILAGTLEFYNCEAL